jgi:phenylacetate-CoA ligase
MFGAMADLEQLYGRLPTSLQHLACSVEGFRIQRSRFGRAFDRIASDVRSRSSWSRDQLEEFRCKRVREFVQHALETVPYYRRMRKQLELDPRGSGEIDLSSLPILDKVTVQRSTAEFVSDAVPKELRTAVHTSGTTGAGLRFATTLPATQEQWAVWWRYRAWHGLTRDLWCGYFGGRSVVPTLQARPPFWRYNIPGKQILFSGYHVSDDNLPQYVAELRRRRPPWLHGYPSLLALLAGHLLSTGSDLGYELKAVTVGAENLLPQQAELMARAFGIRPRQHYGMAEAVANMSECEEGALHIDEDFAAVELLPIGNTGTASVIGTNLSNPATPLLRYDTGDIARASPEVSCGCGRWGRLVERVDGRKEDYVLLGKGVRVGRMDHVFKDMTTIREAQIVQSRIGAISVKIVRASGYDEAVERWLLAELRKRVGPDLAIDFAHVEHLERSTTGKLRFVVSHLTQGQLASAESRRADQSS